jgi:hypothetical protein
MLNFEQVCSRYLRVFKLTQVSLMEFFIVASFCRFLTEILNRRSNLRSKLIAVRQKKKSSHENLLIFVCSSAVLVIRKRSVMYRRLSSIQCLEPKLWKKLLNCQTQSTKISSLNPLNTIRFTTNCNINYQSLKPDEPHKQHSSLLHSALTSFKGNPYVRLMRLDRPIGKIEKKTSTIP